jgi:rhodanese-related sulfurtransferase
MADSGEIRFVDARTVADLMAKGQATLIDVREDPEFQASGYKGDILRMAGGIKAWRAEGLPVER